MKAGDEFEEQVRRLARSVFADDLFVERDAAYGREYDMTVETRDSRIYIECTTDQRKEKVEKDTKKIHRRILDESVATAKFCRGLIVTKEVPTQHQIEEVKKYQGLIQIISYEELRSRLIDASEYLSARKNYRFGSYEDITNGKVEFNAKTFVCSNLTDLNSGEKIKYDKFCDANDGDVGNIYLLTGDYGVGKSTLLASLFMSLRKSFLRKKTYRLPIFINLREHKASRDPSIALLEHGKRLQLRNPEGLVRAWRSGIVTLILDGFDELSAQSTVIKFEKFREYRRSSVELVSSFIKETPHSVPIYISGRRYYFDSDAECYDALGLKRREFSHISIDEFSEEDIASYLRQLGRSTFVPSWMPTKPLLIAQLASMGSINNEVSIEQMNAALGWNYMLDRVSEREAQQTDNLDVSSVRALLERLATNARRSADGLGPVSIQEIAEIYFELFGVAPDQEAQRLILRFPGTRASDAGDGSRIFIDADLAAAARAGDLARAIVNVGRIDERINESFRTSLCAASELTRSVLSLHLDNEQVSEKNIYAAVGDYALDVPAAT